MTSRLHFGAVIVLAALTLGGCGATDRAPETPSITWPPRAKEGAAEGALDALGALGSLDGAEIRVRAHLMAVTLPCPVCGVGERRGTEPELRIGQSARAGRARMPGCLPCPQPAATFEGSLRATGVVEALQQRHIGHLFLLSGTFHDGVLEVRDVAELDAPQSARP